MYKCKLDIQNLICSKRPSPGQQLTLPWKLLKTFTKMEAISVEKPCYHSNTLPADTPQFI